MQEIPNSVYYLAGVIVFTNVGIIASFLFGTYKCVWWISKLDSRVTKAQETANRAHQRLDKIEG